MPLPLHTILIFLLLPNQTKILIISSIKHTLLKTLLYLYYYTVVLGNGNILTYVICSMHIFTCVLLLLLVRQIELTDGFV